MLADIVVDTNVLMHADNPQEVRQPACSDLIAEMRDASVRGRGVRLK